MNVKEWTDKMIEAGLLEDGLRLGIVNPTRIRHDEIIRYFYTLRAAGLTYMQAVCQTSIDQKISEGWLRNLLTGRG